MVLHTPQVLRFYIKQTLLITTSFAMSMCNSMSTCNSMSAFWFQYQTRCMPCVHQWATRSTFPITTPWVNNLDDANTNDQWRRLPLRSSANFLKPFLKERPMLTHQPLDSSTVGPNKQDPTPTPAKHKRTESTVSNCDDDLHVARCRPFNAFFDKHAWLEPFSPIPSQECPPCCMLFAKLTKGLIPPLLPLLFGSLANGWQKQRTDTILTDARETNNDLNPLSAFCLWKWLSLLPSRLLSVWHKGKVPSCSSYSSSWDALESCKCFSLPFRYV